MPDNQKLPKESDNSKQQGNSLKDGDSQGPWNPKKPDPSRKRTTVIMTVIFIVVAVFVGSQIFAMNSNDAVDTLDTGQFIKAVEQGRVESVVYAANDYTVTGTYYPASTAGNSIASAFNTAFDSINLKLSQMRTSNGTRLPSISTMTPELFNLGSPRAYSSVYVGADSLEDLLAQYPNIQYRITLPNGFASILISLLPFVLIAALLIFFFSQMQKANNSQLSFGKNKAKKTMEERPDVKFSDVAGVDEAVEEMQEVKDFLANPKKYQSIGAKIPRGCLLVGPPGTGKTLLARAVAGEAGVPFFSISGSDFVEMFVGVGASRVRDLFKDAKEAAPSIIFIDEIDAVGRQRGTGLGGGHDEREQTLNQLLVEMDGFEANESVVLIAATNRSDVLDPALLRPGRFDRQIVVDTPDVRGREQILKVHSADKPIGSDVDLPAIAKITPGFTGADLANLMNEAALLTARKSKKIITMREVNESLERVIAGPERKGRVLNERVKRTIAYHESGHALVGHLLNNADPVHKISIISRGRALGYTLSIPDDDKPLNTLSEMRDELAVFMGGRVAEEIFCDDITTGASNDLERASKMARAIVTQYGMSPLGTQVFGQPNREVFLGRDYGNERNYSEETARLIDEEVSKIMKEAHDRAHQILTSNADQMDLMASVLLERETIEGEACQALLDNKWQEYLEREVEIIAAHEREEAAARAKDLENNPDLTREDIEGRPIHGSDNEEASSEQPPAGLPVYIEEDSEEAEAVEEPKADVADQAEESKDDDFGEIEFEEHEEELDEEPADEVDESEPEESVDDAGDSEPEEQSGHSGEVESEEPDGAEAEEEEPSNEPDDVDEAEASDKDIVSDELAEIAEENDLSNESDSPASESESEEASETTEDEMVEDSENEVEIDHSDNEDETSSYSGNGYVEEFSVQDVVEEKSVSDPHDEYGYTSLDSREETDSDRISAEESVAENLDDDDDELDLLYLRGAHARIPEDGNLDIDSGIFSDSSTVKLVNPDWRNARVEPGDQDPNGPYRKAAENADKSDMPSQSEINIEIEHEDEMLSSPYAPDPDRKPKSDLGPYDDPYGLFK